MQIIDTKSKELFTFIHCLWEEWSRSMTKITSTINTQNSNALSMNSSPLTNFIYFPFEWQPTMGQRIERLFISLFHVIILKMKWNPLQLSTVSIFNEWTATILIQNEYNKVQILYYIIYSRYANPKHFHQFAFTDYHFVRKRVSKKKKNKHKKIK